MSHPREPIKYTCPDIDKYIKYIKFVLCKDRDLRNMEKEELYDVAKSMNQQLEECIDYLETLRESNNALRKWGIEEAEEVDKLTEKLELNETRINK